MSELLFVGYEEAFLPSMFRWRNQASTLKFNPMPSITVDEFRLRCEAGCSELSLLGERDRFRWCLVFDGELVGQIGFCFNAQDVSAEIGYVIDERFHGRGFATCAVRILVVKVFGETSIRKLVAEVRADNFASKRVLQNAGFYTTSVMQEGTMPKVIFTLERS